MSEPAFLGWVAGILEGEGTVTITSSGARYTRPSVSVTSTDPEIIAPIHERWPGALSTRQPPGNARVALTWRLDRRRPIEAFLVEIAPYLRTSRTKLLAELVLEDVRARQQGARRPGYREACEERRERVRALNRRGA